MPLTASGSKILASMTKQYGAKRGKAVFYASINKGNIPRSKVEKISKAGSRKKNGRK